MTVICAPPPPMDPSVDGCDGWLVWMESRVGLFAQIRTEAQVQGLSVRAPPARQGVSRRLEPLKTATDAMLLEYTTAPRKQRHAARRTLARLVRSSSSTASPCRSMDENLHRQSALRRDRRPTRLQWNHHRNRHLLLPPRSYPRPPKHHLTVSQRQRSDRKKKGVHPFRARSLAVLHPAATSIWGQHISPS